MKNKKVISILALLVLFTSCAGLKFLPENFDGNEYMKLSELSVISELSATCNFLEIASMNFHSAVLMKYSEGTLKVNIAEIYKGIYNLTAELVERVNPSSAYCKLKRANISKLVNEAMDTFGDRKK